MNLAESIYYFFYLRRRHKFEQPVYRRAAATFRTPFPCKIISIGNITTGGTGKTPAVQWVARLLQANSVRVAVVARGYGGRLSQQGAVVSDSSQVFLAVEDAGDEPLLHARALPGVPVVIGRDRVAAVAKTLQQFQTEVIVLDDGFQYWSLPRDLDLVLLDARRPFDNGKLLPYGRLREPPSALQRADALFLTRSDLASASELKATYSRLEQFTKAPVFEASHVPVKLQDEAKAQSVDLTALRDLPVGLISALADNTAFTQTLRTCGAVVVESLQRRDHHHWKVKELQSFVSRAVASGAKAIITTEKDAVKIQPDWLQPLPLWSVGIKLSINTGEEALEELILETVELKTRSKDKKRSN